MTRSDASKLTPHTIVMACRAGGRLCKSYSRAGAVFSLHPGGRRIEPKYALKAIGSGKLAPARDGLFANDTQTWTAPSPAGAEFPELPDFLKRARSS